MKPLVLLLIALLVGTLATAAQARKPRPAAEPDDYVNKPLPDGGTVWHCWYDGDTSVLCRLGEAADETPAPAPAAAAAADPRLPALVTTIWQRAAELADRLIAVPLHTIPYDMASTGDLADAAMCGGARKPCGVIFARDAALLGDLVRRRTLQLAARRAAPLALND